MKSSDPVAVMAILAGTLGSVLFMVLLGPAATHPPSPEIAPEALGVTIDLLIAEPPDADAVLARNEESRWLFCLTAAAASQLQGVLMDVQGSQVEVYPVRCHDTKAAYYPPTIHTPSGRR